MQEKESIMVVRCELKIPSLGVTVTQQALILETEFSIWASQLLTRAVRGSDYSPAIALSEEKDKLV